MGYLPRNEYPGEEDLSTENVPAATLAFREGLNDAMTVLRQEQREIVTRSRSITEKVADAGRQLSEMLSRPQIGENFKGLQLAGWIQGGDQFPADSADRLSAPPGRVMLVDFMFVQCPPCQAALPKLSGLYDEYRARGLTVVSVVPSWGQRGIYGLVERKHLTHPVALLVERQEEEFAIKAYPSYLLIDRQGKIRWSSVAEEPQMELIESLLSEKP